MIVNFGPGGGADGMGRTVARLLSPLLGVPVPASNVAGAAGNTGLTKVAGAKGDGYNHRDHDRSDRVLVGLRHGQPHPRRFLLPGDRAVIAVHALRARGQSFASYQDLLDHTRDNPGEVRVRHRRPRHSGTT